MYIIIADLMDIFFLKADYNMKPLKHKKTILKCTIVDDVSSLKR